jgi:transcriptional activator
VDCAIQVAGDIRHAQINPKHVVNILGVGCFDIARHQQIPVTTLGHPWCLLSHDPCRENAHRVVMRCYVRRGEQAAALRHYHICAHIMHTEFGWQTDPRQRLFRRYRSGGGRSNKSGTSSQVISLPEGGGALQGKVDPSSWVHYTILLAAGCPHDARDSLG